MSAALNQPVTQVRFTNVAIVRLKRAGKRFEVAAYKNKVVNWRNKVETDVDEVLHTQTVFQNVTKGVIAKSKDLKKAFGTDDHAKCALIILDKGELQVSERERQVAYESMFRDVATIVSEKCVNPDSHRPYTYTMIERALKDIHFAVSVSKSAKKQALVAIARLKESIPIERAQMRLRLTVPAREAESLKSKLASLSAVVEKEEWGTDTLATTVLADPGQYRAIDEHVVASSRGTAGCGLEVLDLAVQAEGTADIDEEEERRATERAAAAGGAGGADEVGGDGSGAASGRAGKGRGRDKDVAGGGTSSHGKVVRGSKKLSCNTCGAAFDDRGAHREHFRSEWHRVNLKRKMAGQPPVDEAEFEAWGGADGDMDAALLDI